MTKPFYLLSYPRSGNHWTRYLIEYFSGYPTSNEQAKFGDVPDYTHYDSPVLSRCGLGIGDVFDGRPFIAYKRHFIYEYDNKNRPIILVFRPWQEAVTRHLLLSGVSDMSITNEHVKRELSNWAQHLVQYANWPMKDKTIIYYSELVLSPEAAIRAISPFLPEPVDERAITAFMANIKQHKERAFSTVAAKQGTSYDGEKWYLNAHGQLLTDKDVAEWEAFLSCILKPLNIDTP